MKKIKKFLDYTFIEKEGMHSVNVRNILLGFLFINAIFLIMWCISGFEIKPFNINICYIWIGWNILMIANVVYGILKVYI